MVKLHKGPRGGKYYLKKNKKGKQVKVYVKSQKGG